jgi:hypothetical protein
LVQSTQGDCGCDKGRESMLRQAIGSRLPAAGTDLTQSASTVLSSARRLGNNVIPIGGPLDPRDRNPFPCAGFYRCFDICLPFLGCHNYCVWECIVF